MNNANIIKTSKQFVKDLLLEARLYDIPFRIKLDNLNTECLSIRGRDKVVEILINPIYVKLKIMKCVAFHYCEYTKGLDLGSRKQRLLFALAHEIAHLIQHIRHFDWKLKFDNPEYELMFATDKEYRETKLEKNADKIARILFKKVYNRALTNAK